MATTASLPVLATTESFTVPCWMYITVVAGSPWTKMRANGWYRSICFVVPEESRNLCASNTGVCERFLGFVVAISLSPAGTFCHGQRPDLTTSTDWSRRYCASQQHYAR